MRPLGGLGKKDSSVLLNLKFEGTNGSQVFTDSSIYNRTVSVSTGSPALSTTSPLSGNSSLLLGTNGSISIPNFTAPVNTIIKTIEFRIKADLATIANGASQGILVKGFSNSFFQAYSHQCIITRNASGNGGKIRMYWGISVVSAPASYLELTVSDISANNHIAFTQRTNGIYACYLNGVLGSTSGFVQIYDVNTSPILVGAVVYDWALGVDTAKFIGRIDNFRISNVDTYPSGPFTPPT